MKAKLLITAIYLTAIALGVANSCAHAQQTQEEIKMMINELRIFPVHQLKRVAVGHPDIFDVTIVSKEEIMLMAKKAGASGLIIWDNLGRRSFKVSVVARSLEALAQRIRGLLADLDISAVWLKTEEDLIYVMGEVLTEREIEGVRSAIQGFPEVINLVKIKERLPLIEIDVQVLEVAIDDFKRLGLSWSSSLPLSYTEPCDEGGDIPKVWRVFSWDRNTIVAKLNFLIKNGKARTLANPKLLTLSGKKATFLVGGEVPYLTVQTEGRTQVEWKQYGVDMSIKPEVNSKNEIRTKIEAKVSDVDAGTALTHSGYSMPGMKTRTATTEVLVNDGDTIILAGLIKNDDSRALERVPWLSKVPILGQLFRSTDFRSKRTELVIALTPRIIGEKANPDYITSEVVQEEALLAAQRQFPIYSEEDSPLVYYSHMIEDLIGNALIYPLEAREAKQEGIVKLDLHLLSNGQLKEVEIKESSGFRILDEAALASVQELVPYPSFPSEITQRELRITVPLVFKSYVKNE